MRIPLSERPKISIITPTYNREHFLRETLEHILKLEYDNWEWIIIDDGSTDGTEKLILESAKSLNKIRYFKRAKEHSKGPSGCRNQGIDLAWGKFIVFVDDDDIVHPDLLNITSKILIENPKASYCRYDKNPFRGKWDPKIMDNIKQGNHYYKFHRNDITRMITGDVPFACCTVMWRREALRGERFNEDLSYAEEWEYYNRLIIQNDYGISLNRVLYYNRKHEHSNTGEFWANNYVRRASKIKATEFVINNLGNKNLISDSLADYFIKLGFFLKSYLIISLALEYSNASFFKSLKYKLGYRIYPLLRPFFKIKERFKS